MRAPHWVWPLVIVASALGAALASLAPSGQPLRMVVESWFLLVCPGMALVRLLRLGDRLTEWCVAVALSLALDALLPDVLVYLGVWSTGGALAGLVGLSVVSAGLALAGPGLERRAARARAVRLRLFGGRDRERLAMSAGGQ